MASALEAERQQGFGSRLLLCSLTDEDLTAYPGLANLLVALTKHMDASGLSLTLVQQLEEARRELQLRRTKWLKWEALHRLLLESLRELGTAPQDRKFLDVLEQQLLIAELRRILDFGQSLQGTQLSLIGLMPSCLKELLPTGQDLEQMQKQLLAELEKRLKLKCMAVLGYYFPESEGFGENPHTAVVSTLGERLVTEKLHFQEARTRYQELMGLLEQQKAAYPQVLLRCLALLKCLARKYRLGAQSELDRLNTQYLEIKCSAMFLKIRLEELSIFLETYTPEKVNVHRTIRDKLQTTIEQEEQNLATSRKILSNYEILGPEFEELVKEYTQLQAIIENRRWAVTEFNKD